MYSKEVYKKHNGKIFVISSIITFVCFLYFVYITFFAEPMKCNDVVENFCDIVGLLLGCVVIIGFLGFPISLGFYASQEKMYMKSRLLLKDNKIYYSKQAIMHYTLLGKVDEKHVYEISEFENYKITNRWIILYGKFRYTQIYQGNNHGKPITQKVKIARAFETDDEIINFIKSGVK